MGGKRVTFDIFLEKAKKIHGDKYNYIKPKLFKIRDKIGIICPQHGTFYQRGDAHLSGQGCGKCANSIVYDQDEYLKLAYEKHGNKYDYSLINYKNIKIKIKIICPEHGLFEQTPDNHLYHGCPNCAIENVAQKRINNSANLFIKKLKEVHGNQYDYSQCTYIKSDVKLRIICKKHGVFYMKFHEHLRGRGCPICGNIISKEENLIKEWIENDLKIKTIKHKINGFEIDIFLPDYNLGIEYNGLYWHSNKFKDKNYHLNKTELCEKNNIQLLHIFEDEWINKKEIIKSIIKSKLGLNEKIYARKCIIKEITAQESREFLNKNHLQGYIGAKYKLGLFYNNELVSLMTFGKKRVSMGSKKNKQDEYEMIRFCNKIGINVIGGASKLFKYFIKKYNPSSIISFADRRYSDGNLYKKMDFEYLYNTKPNYFYFKKHSLKREHRFKYRKDVLVKEGYNKNKTEFQIMDEREYLKIYDSGNMKFVWNLE
ncbi:MAG: hypothetical protein ACOCVF_02580 [bacterium]